MATAVTRVRLPPEAGPAVSHRSRTLSHCGSDGALTMNSTTQAPAAEDFTQRPESSIGIGVTEASDLPLLVQQLEAMQAQQRSVQQPSADVDRLLAQVLQGRPEWRARMAVLTRSALLRQKILAAVPSGTRAVGSGTLGSTHPWRQPAAERTMTKAGLTERVAAPCVASDKVRVDPTISHTENYSISRAQRFEGVNEIGEVDRSYWQHRSTPGPGAYSKSLPRGTAFHDGGERVVLGANHTYAFRRVLGRQINPVDVDATSLPSAPAYSFGGARRTLSETAVGHGQRDGGPVKSDLGALTPGPVYEALGSMRPKAGGGTASMPSLRRTRSRQPGVPRVRCIPVPPEEEPKEADPSERDEQ